MLKTLRVANPADPTRFMTINAADYREAVHGALWPDQLPDFEGVPAPAAQRMDPAVRDLAAGMMFDGLDMEALVNQQPPFSSLSPVQQLTHLRDKRQEFNEARTRFLRDRQVSDKERGELRPGFTTEQLASQGGEHTPPPAPAAPAPPAPAAPAAPTEKPAETPPAPPAPPAGAPWAAKAAATPAKPALTVEKGPGSKWFVMDGKEPKSAGFSTKAEAEKALEGMKAAE